MNKDLLKSEVLIKMVFEENIDTKEEYSELLLNYLSDSILTNMTEEFNDNVSSLKYKLEAMSEALDIYNDKKAMNSYFFGIIKTVIELSGKINREKCLMRDVNKIERTEYGKNILHLLYEVKTINHGTLAQKMNISTHSLTNFMKRMEDTNLWSKSKYGKYTNYDITPIGEKCYQYMIISNNNQIKTNDHKQYMSYINKIIRLIIEEVASDNPDVNKIAHEMVKDNMKLTEIDEKFIRLNISQSIRRKNNKFRNIINDSEYDVDFVYTESDASNIKHDIEGFLNVNYRNRQKLKKNNLLELIGR